MTYSPELPPVPWTPDAARLAWLHAYAAGVYTIRISDSCQLILENTSPRLERNVLPSTW